VPISGTNRVKYFPFIFKITRDVLRLISINMTLTLHVQPCNGVTQTNGVINAHGVSDWKQVAARRRDEIYSKIPKDYLLPPSLLSTSNLVNLAQTSGKLNTHELSIISLSAIKLLECIHHKVFTAVEVTTAFCKSAAIAHQAV